ncbi:hypothetical protein BHE74_00000333 [Ensete ventricosum]|nr:hypothetical protein GW17_00031688 [Ensete ventricosum]RWW90637.1 hypothetical protein BHE74_00000333 [Ensete ventricosum]RZR78196.1 hypothetical protein BHM03_00003471 [Ensete ventricosum]
MEAVLKGEQANEKGELNKRKELHRDLGNQLGLVSLFLLGELVKTEFIARKRKLKILLLADSSPLIHTSSSLSNGSLSLVHTGHSLKGSSASLVLPWPIRVSSGTSGKLLGFLTTIATRQTASIPASKPIPDLYCSTGSGSYLGKESSTGSGKKEVN